VTSQALPTRTPTRLQTRLSGIRNALATVLPRIKDFFIHALGQVRVLKKAYPGLMHALIFWGVTIQVLGTALNLMQMQLFIPLIELPFPRGGAYLAYELVMDLAGIAILAGVSMALFRRLALRPKSLETRWDDYYALALLGLIPIAGFMLEATRLLSAAPPWSGWSPVGNFLARIFGAFGMTSGTAAGLHTLLFWTHAALGLTLFASIPFTKLRHLVFTPLNVVVRSRRKDGVLAMIENIEETELLGVGKITEFTPRQLLSLDACVRCGRCEEVCPAAISGMAYSPRTLIRALRDDMVATLNATYGKNEHELLGDVLAEELPWSCTTCGACLVRCPAFVNPVDEIIDLRRYQVLTTGKMPKTVGESLRNMERQGNPWGMPPEERLAWAEGLEVRELTPGDETDVLLFLGCAFAFDERNKKVARSFAGLLQKMGVDFGILGMDEMCCGETARRLGHEYLFQVLAQDNIAILSQIKFNRIVTQCPHCFNTLKEEYPQFGGDFKVQHYTEYMAESSILTDLAAANDSTSSARLAYHDSCYLGRYNQIYQAPRQLLDQVGTNRVEMLRREENSFCCGGGGGQMWLETDAETRINHRRLEDAKEVQAEVVATACPYCLIMFDDAIRSKGLGDDIQVVDIAEILEKNLSGS
jgi:Fe-S oxidoreductase/nitrate reductase gamma subunit